MALASRSTFGLLASKSQPRPTWITPDCTDNSFAGCNMPCNMKDYKTGKAGIKDIQIADTKS